MTTNDKDRSFRQIDAWLSILGSFLLYVLMSYFLFPVLQTAFPEISNSSIWYLLAIPIDLLPIVYLYFRCGPIGISDFALEGMDFVVVFISLIVLVIGFSTISLTVGFESLVTYREISRLHGFEYLITIFILFLIGPFLEETLFRRYIYEIFRDKFGSLTAILMVTLIETLMHISYWNIGALILLFFSTIFLTVIYIKTRLGASIIVHCVINIFMVFG